MKFIIIPKDIWNSYKEEALQRFGITEPRTIEGETRVILHIDHYNELVPFPLAEEGDIPYPVYDQNDPEFRKLIDIVEV